MNKPLDQLSPNDLRSLEASIKVGLLATVTADGLPHLTLISTLKGSSPGQLVFGQFMEGRSKAHLLTNPKAGWLVMTLDKNLWRGKARFTHTARNGPDYDFFNNTPLFRYNAYFGVHTVYYLDLVEHRGREPLPMKRVILSALQTQLARRLTNKHTGLPAMNAWTQDFLNRLNGLKFLAYLGADGYPQIWPLIQAQTAGPGLALFATGPYQEEMEAIPAGTVLALFGMSLEMEAVLVRGVFEGFRLVGGVRCGFIRIDWIYNAMPPVPGQIYPQLPLDPVTEF